MFGPHVQTWTDNTVRWCERARPSCIKVVATQEYIPTLAEWIQKGWLKDIILRSDPQDYLMDWGGDIEAQAREEATRNLDFADPFKAAGLGQYLWLEGRNEQPVWNDEQMILYATHEAIRANIISSSGLRALCFQFAVGHPDISLWFHAIGMLRAIKGYGGGLALHQYSQPRLDSAGDWTTWRHHKVLAELPKDLHSIPLFVTEGGIDGGVQYDGCPTPAPREGWRYYTNEEDYLEQLKATAPMLGGVRGYLLFTFGNPGGDSPWGSFEHDDTMLIADWVGQGIVLPEPGNPAESHPGASHDATEGENNMDEATRNQIWNDWLKYPAFIKFRADHPELGDALSLEKPYGIWTVQHFGGGIAFCKTGDWGNIQIATSKEELPSPL